MASVETTVLVVVILVILLWILIAAIALPHLILHCSLPDFLRYYKIRQHQFVVPNYFDNTTVTMNVDEFAEFCVRRNRASRVISSFYNTPALRRRRIQVREDINNWINDPYGWMYKFWQ